MQWEKLVLVSKRTTTKWEKGNENENGDGVGDGGGGSRGKNTAKSNKVCHKRARIKRTNKIVHFIWSLPLTEIQCN